MAGSLATTSIITKGLTGGSACSGLITARFSLYVHEEIVIPPKPPVEGGGGGPYPGPAWNKVSNIHQFFKPVPDHLQPYVIPRDQEANYFRKNTVVTFRVKFGETVTEKTYVVPHKRRQAVVRIFKLIDATRSKVAVTIGAINQIATRMKAFVSNVRVKRTPNK